jgi:pyruvate decarboxylase
MQYGSIGWATGATFGYATAVQGRRRVISLIGDGSFQLTAQEVANMIRYKLNPIIFLINNRGYTIEVEIHDGPYNKIKNWNYSELIKAFNAEDGKGWGCQVSTEAELAAAVEKALANKELSFIEVMIDPDDCNKNLLEWGTKVGINNAKPPRID